MKLNTIEWHRNNLKNANDYRQRMCKKRCLLDKEINKLTDDYNFLSFQIELAEKENKATFNSAKYKVKKK